jgi:hypothetical protein
LASPLAALPLDLSLSEAEAALKVLETDDGREAYASMVRA